MDPKEKIIEDFKKYITGVYLLQQDFIDDIESGLKAVIEQYHIEFSSKDNVEVTVKEVSKKEEVKPSSSQHIPLPLPVHSEEDEIVPKEEQTENSVNTQEEQMVPQSVIDTLANTEEKVKKKAGRKPGSKNKDTNQTKKKRMLTPYTMYVKENSKRVIQENIDRKLTQKERMEILGKEWEAVKEDTEKYNYYLDLTQEKNKEQIEENEKLENQ
jgi:hypothetical protein